MNLEEKSSIIFAAVQAKPGPKTINRFNLYCSNPYRGQCLFIKTELGIHTVVLKISVEIPDKAKTNHSQYLITKRSITTP
jgi:hypothetical protein